MEQGDQTSAATRSQAEQSAINEDVGSGLAWVGMQWRMDGYCGRADGNQQQCGSDGAVEGVEPQAHPPQPVTSEAEPMSLPLPLSRRSRPVRRGPGQQLAA